MGSADDTQQTQNSQQTGNFSRSGTQTQTPWDLAVPTLSGLLGQVGGQMGAATATPQEDTAIGGLERNAGYGSSFLPYITNTANELFTGGPDRRGNVVSNYKTFQRQVDPTISGKYLNPETNPFFNETRDKLSRDAMNRVNALYAGSGRDFAGAGSGAYTAGRGVAEATAPLFSSIYESERGRQEQAMRDLLGAGTGEIGQLSALDQQNLANKQAGVGVAGQAQDFANQPWQNMLAAEAYKRNIPLGALASLIGLTTPIASLGKNTSSTESGTTTGTGSQFSETDPSIFKSIADLGSIFRK